MFATCYRCGAPADIDLDDGCSAVCLPCEDQFQTAMRTTYPFGQCWQCGAEGREWTCPSGKIHVVFSHTEGGCSQWRDREPLYDEHGRIVCDLCPRPAVTRSWAQAQHLDLADLPF